MILRDLKVEQCSPEMALGALVGPSTAPDVQHRPGTAAAQSAPHRLLEKLGPHVLVVQLLQKVLTVELLRQTDLERLPRLGLTKWNLA